MKSIQSPVRLGIIGMGNIGNFHYAYLHKGTVKRAELMAVCDIEPDKLKPFTQYKTFTRSEDLIRSGWVDAVIISTPHYDHTTIGIDALQQGLHVLVEKPISVHKADCQRLIAAHKNKKQVFCAMFQMRTDPRYQRIRKLIRDGELGEIRRINWIITDWFRPAAYYASSGWRATWRGEGGGVLLNQCPHNLDLMWWLWGMPTRVHAFCNFGKYHDIEVEDEVTAYLEYQNGATGVFVTTTGEAPGTNRLEIAGDRGKLVYEHGKITFNRTKVSVRDFCNTTRESFAQPPTWNVEIPVSGSGTQHAGIVQNFVDAILDGAPLLAPAEEGIHSVELANAMLYSSFTNRSVDIPLDAKAYERALKKRITTSRYKKKTVAMRSIDMAVSFGK